MITPPFVLRTQADARTASTVFLPCNPRPLSLSAMEFWGVEVKAGEPLKVSVDDDFVVHLSQAALGESKKDKGSDPVVIFVEFDSKKYVLGTLTRESIPQISLDVVFEKEFALSHNWKNGSVYFCGYKANQGPNDESEEDFSDDESLDEDQDVPLLPSVNGTTDLKVKDAKPVSKSNATQAEQPGKKAKVTVHDKEKDEEDDDSSEFESDDDDESGDSDEDMINAEDGSDDDSEEDEEEEEPQPKGKKRTNPVQQKTPVSAKKSKPSTPLNTDAKKGVHTATPHPAKKAGKAPAGGDQTPKSSGGQFSCKTCKKGFGSESGLEQHTKAKHGGS